MLWCSKIQVFPKDFCRNISLKKCLPGWRPLVLGSLFFSFNYLLNNSEFTLTIFLGRGNFCSLLNKKKLDISAATEECSQNGGELFYPISEADIRAIKSMYGKDLNSFFIQFRDDVYAEGLFVKSQVNRSSKDLVLFSLDRLFAKSKLKKTFIYHNLILF